MKNLKPFFLLVVVVAFFAGCNGKKAQKNNSENDSVVSTVFTVDSLLTAADQLVNKTITVEGTCTHLCTHSGKKLFLEGSADSVSIRAEAEKPFRQECIDKRVRVTGKLIEERIDEPYLAEWESEINVNDSTHEGCKTEKNAVGQKNMNSEQQRIDDFRSRIAEEKSKTGKDYLAFYHIETANYRVVE